MPDRLTHAAGQTYLVEHYEPGARAEELERLATRVRDTIFEMRREGSSVSYVGSTIVPGDDYLHCVLQAPSERLVRDVLSRAGMAHDRISAAISVAGRSDDDALRLRDVGAASSVVRPITPASDDAAAGLIDARAHDRTRAGEGMRPQPRQEEP